MNMRTFAALVLATIVAIAAPIASAQTKLKWAHVYELSLIHI